MTHSYVWHDSFICVTWLIHMCDMTHSYVWHDAFICVTWLIHMRGMTHSYVWHDSFICVTWLIHMCGMTHSYVWHDSFICVTWLIHMCDMTHSYVWHDSFICVPNASCQKYIAHVWHAWFVCVSRLIHMCDMTHSYAWHDSFICGTWLIYLYACRMQVVTNMSHAHTYDAFDASCMMYYRHIIVTEFIEAIIYMINTVWTRILCDTCDERWGAGVETQKYVRGDIGGWGRVPSNETYAPSLSTICDGA